MREGRWVVVAVVMAIALLVACGDVTPTVSPLPTESPTDGDVVGGDGFDFAGAVEWALNHIEEIALASGLIVAVVDGGLKKARALAVSLMLEAEKVARDEVQMGGPEKMRRVLSRFVERLPSDARAILRVWAGFRGQSLDELTASLAQDWYEKAVG